MLGGYRSSSSSISSSLSQHEQTIPRVPATNQLHPGSLHLSCPMAFGPEGDLIVQLRSDGGVGAEQHRFPMVSIAFPRRRCPCSARIHIDLGANPWLGGDGELKIGILAFSPLACSRASAGFTVQLPVLFMLFMLSPLLFMPYCKPITISIDHHRFVIPV